jgi:hypothetical protein
MNHSSTDKTMEGGIPEIDLPTKQQENCAKEQTK